MNLTNFSRREINPKVNKSAYKPAPVKLAQSPVVARIRKTQFGSTNVANTSMPSGINVKQVSQKAAALFKAAPKLSIKKL